MGGTGDGHAQQDSEVVSLPYMDEPNFHSKSMNGPNPSSKQHMDLTPPSSIQAIYFQGLHGTIQNNSPGK
jgi:hypothetical protein